MDKLEKCLLRQEGPRRQVDTDLSVRVIVSCVKKYTNQSSVLVSYTEMAKDHCRQWTEAEIT